MGEVKSQYDVLAHSEKRMAAHLAEVSASTGRAPHPPANAPSDYNRWR
jgi:hypothetical protein